MKGDWYRFSREYKEWLSVINQQSTEYEIVPYQFYDTEVYCSGVTSRIRFFDWADKSKSFARCNMYLPGILPNPQSFLIQSIRIHGITSRLQRGSGMLVLGAKHYGMNPAWSYGLKEKGLRLHPHLMIPPQMKFSFELNWEEAVEIGKGIDGQDVSVHPIQVVLVGLLARPVQ